MPIACSPAWPCGGSLFRRERLQEVSGFSVFMLLLDAAYKVNYSTDVLVIGACSARRRSHCGRPRSA